MFEHLLAILRDRYSEFPPTRLFEKSDICQMGDLIDELFRGLRTHLDAQPELSTLHARKVMEKTGGLGIYCSGSDAEAFPHSS